jgi:hypothetical protein
MGLLSKFSEFQNKINRRVIKGYSVQKTFCFEKDTGECTKTTRKGKVDYDSNREENDEFSVQVAYDLRHREH